MTLSVETKKIIIPLSAKDSERLKDQAANLLNALLDPEYAEARLEDIAFTLQVGRSAMVSRLAFAVDSIASLKERLVAFLDSEGDVEGLTSGRALSPKLLSSEFGSESVREEKISEWLATEQYQQLINIWVSGHAFKWQRLYTGRRPRRISLPSYAFSTDRCWVSDLAKDVNLLVREIDNSTKLEAEQLAPESLVSKPLVSVHPLLQKNSSSLDQNKYTSIFDGQEFFLCDHRVNGQRILPGVAYLEMARAAIESAQDIIDTDDFIQLSDVLWLHPFFVFQSASALHIALYPEGNNVTRFEIFSDTENETHLIHCEGYGSIKSRKDAFINTIPRTDIQQQLLNFSGNCFSAKQCYQVFGAMGLDYGPSHKGIEELHERRGAVFAKLSLPGSVANTLNQFVLHPSLMDAAIQSCLGTAMGTVDFNDKAYAKPMLPFAVQQTQVFSACTQTMWAYIRPALISVSNKDIVKLDIDLYDAEGVLCVRIEGFCTRELSHESAPKITTSATIEQVSGAVSKDAKPSESAKLSISADYADFALNLVLRTLSEALMVPLKKIKLDTPFKDLGMSSIVQVTIIREFEKITGKLPKTLLFEYNNAGELRDYLVATYSADVLKAGRQPESVHSLDQNHLPAQNARVEAKPAPRQYPNDHRPSPEDHRSSPIAIIGTSGRYPMAKNIQSFWENLKSGKNCISTAPNEHWQPHFAKVGSTGSADAVDTPYTGGFLEGRDYFDYPLFKVNKDDAQSLSPETRQFLEIVWETFEDAGYVQERLNSTQDRHKAGIAVYVGSMYNQYAWSMPTLEHGAILSNSTEWHLANRISHSFDLRGPSIAVNTACSSSLTAIHIACESLKLGNCVMAIAGGVNLTLDASKYSSLGLIGYLEKGEQSKSFGQGEGYIPGEGVGAVLLKNLDLAVADDDQIQGIVRSSFTNHSGGRQMYGVPDPKQQGLLISDSIRRSGIDPVSINYVESAANGSPLGDPIEVVALSKAFGQFTQQKQYCSIGTVKSNVGHLEAASGMSQLSKVLLQLRHKTLVPTINAEPLNPNIEFENTPFYLQNNVSPWDAVVDSSTGKPFPRRCLINAFGAGGSYTSLIIEEYSEIQESSHRQNSDQSYAFQFSAHTEWSLLEYLRRMISFLENESEMSAAEIALTLSFLNHDLPHRAIIATDSKAALLAKLSRLYRSFNDDESAGIFTSNVLAAEDALDNTLSERSRLWVSGDFLEVNHFETKRFNTCNRGFDFPKYAFDYVSERPMFSEVYQFGEPFLKDHTVFGEQVILGVTHGSLAINAYFSEKSEAQSVEIESLQFIDPIKVLQDQRVEISVDPAPDAEEGQFRVRYRYDDQQSWVPTASGRFVEGTFEEGTVDIKALQQSLNKYPHIDGLYSANPIISMGESFETITKLYIDSDQSLARVLLTSISNEEAHQYYLHPLITSSSFIAIMPLLMEQGLKDPFLPFGINSIQIKKSEMLNRCWLHVRVVKRKEEIIIYDADVIDDDGNIVVRLKGCALKRIRLNQPVEAPQLNTQITNAKQINQKPGRTETIMSRRRTKVNASNELAQKIQGYLSEKIETAFPKVVGILNIEMNLMDLGIESNQLVSLTSNIEKETQIRLTATLLFEYPNILELSEHFAESNRPQFLALFSQDSSTLTDVPDKLEKASSEMASYSATDSSFSRDNSSHKEYSIDTVPQYDSADKPGQGGDIAIIGMHGRFSRSENVDQFWTNILDKVDLMEEVPVDHWDFQPWFNADPSVPDKTYNKWGSFIGDVDKFDASFFRISPREAEWMDPQGRLILESIYSSVEDAGYVNQLRKTNTGVFVGACFEDYKDKIAELNLPSDPYAGTGNAKTLLANRVSFLFDLTGPSITIDTACSSSLFALHQAAGALRNGECDMAFVGGANLLLSSQHYRYFCAIGALSLTGRCHTFDEQADGYTPGECIASVLLKPLADAERDNDRVHAVIKGSAALHGGYTPSMTAPSIKGEENVILRAWEDADIDPETLGYIEAHGTGTPLGDPIEIHSLIKAFKRHTQKQQFCVVGSAKANIGHTEGAAGIAGLLKVVQQLKHKIIPALPAFNKLNPNINIEQSALYINDSAQQWPSINGLPRRAGISSFGFSGAYAHVVIEEYVANETDTNIPIISSINPALIVLSAKNKERLQDKIDGLLNTVSDRQLGNEDLASIAYTLQVGREMMHSRLAFVVTSINELKDKLQQSLSNNPGLDSVFHGESSPNKMLSAETETALDNALDGWVERQQYRNLISMWCEGAEFDWRCCYGDNRPKILSLPAYPFAKERHWLPLAHLMPFLPPASGVKQLHPLLHENTSNFSEQRYSSVFSGQEFFLADHVIGGQHLMPGVAYLEMARAAMELSINEIKNTDTPQTVQIENVVWIKPFIVGVSSEAVHVSLLPSKQTGKLGFEIYELNSDNIRQVFCQGDIQLVSAESRQLDLERQRNNCSESVLDAKQCYDLLATIGLEYGAAHQGIERLYLGSDKVLAKLKLPEVTAASLGSFLLHPSIMDSALQATLGLSTVESYNGIYKTTVPFALKHVQTFSPCSDTMWALIRRADGCNKEDLVQKIDIDLCHDDGTVAAELRGFSTRTIEQATPTDNVANIDTMASAKLAPVMADVPAYNAGQPATVPSKTVAGGVESNVTKERVVFYLKTLLSSGLKLPTHRIESEVTLDQYGIDSFMITRITTELEKAFGSLSKTLFFEYQTLSALADYFLISHRQSLIQLLSPAGGSEQSTPSSNVAESPMLTSILEHSQNLKRTPDIDNPISYRHQVSARDLSSTSQDALDIAIIGLSGRYPQAATVEAFWQNLAAGKDSITEVPKERWDHDLYFDEDKTKRGKTYSKWGGFIDGVANFDPLFFNISPLEAEYIEPQERLFLQCVYETIQDAGYTRESLGGAHNRPDQDSNIDANVGVFVGVMYEEYQLYGAQELEKGRPMALTGSPASIANRASYFCNFDGPSIALDTMCSSSLTTIHLACQSIRNRECALAIAGGVNVSVHPNKYLFLGQSKFVSSVGRCASFGEGGDGYVPGEGVGAILLKPLALAEQDHDQIYGVIKGTAVNHGAKTNGYTVPNPHAQFRVISRALKDACIDPRAVSYIEAHGTGTALGDPIEIFGLSKTFQESTQDKQFCALGSAKSNIGHCESAAGIAGVTKVLLQMKYQKIAPSLHSSTLNPNIDFANTSFYVPQRLTDWERPIVKVDGVAREVPRIAGISSFGAGGANAHIVIEEYDSTKLDQHSYSKNQNPALIVLSARNRDRLTVSIERLLFQLESEQFQEKELVDIAYTLQVGREAMDERLGLMAHSAAELTQKLRAFLANETVIEGLYHNQVKANREALSTFTSDSDTAILIGAWFEKGKYNKLLESWSKGLSIDWNYLYSDSKPKRLSLPTYPFNQDRYWVPQSPNAASDVKGMGQTAKLLHPLVHENTSDFTEQRYSTHFSGEEFFLADHLVGGDRILPGVAYLEMVRAAVAQAQGGTSDKHSGSGIQINNVVWLSPVIVKDGFKTIHITLNPREDQSIAFEVYSAGIEGNHQVFCQGTVCYTDGIAQEADLEAFKARCNKNVWTGQSCYDIFSSLGIIYGTTLQSIESLYTGGEQVMAKLKLPHVLSGSLDEYKLHPSILDGALQSTLGLMFDQGDQEPGKTILPFALEQVLILEPFTEAMWVLIRRSEGNTKDDKVQKLDIELCDEQGKICVQLRGFSGRVISVEQPSIPTTAQQKTAHQSAHQSVLNSALLVQPIWNDQAIAPQIIQPTEQQEREQQGQHILLYLGFDGDQSELFSNTIQGVNSVALTSAESNFDRIYQDYADQLLEQLQHVFQTNPRVEVRLQLVIRQQLGLGNKWHILSGLKGLLMSAQHENPNLKIQIIEFDQLHSNHAVASQCLLNKALLEDQHVRYVGNTRQICQWHEVATDQVPEQPWKSDSVYLITGGAGGLGLLFANEIAENTEGSTLILTGRSSKDSKIESSIQSIVSKGARVIYEQVDGSDQTSVNNLFKNIKGKYGDLKGIIHSAGITRDSFVYTKTKDELNDVFSPKVRGLVNLDEASRELDLDFILLFSSISGVYGNVGQSDYAAANAFMDEYAHYRNRLVSMGERRGLTLSINWPLWRSGGMQVAEAQQKMMEQAIGIVPLETVKALDGLYRAWSLENAQVMILDGNKRKLFDTFGFKGADGEPLKSNEKLVAASVAAPIKATPFKNEVVRRGTVHEANEHATESVENSQSDIQDILVDMVSALLKVDAEDIDINDALNEYGFDSVSLTAYTNQINQTYKLDLSPTIFFEHTTIRSFASYLKQNFGSAFDSATVTTNHNLNTAPLVPSTPEPVPVKLNDHKPSNRVNRFARQVQQPEHPEKKSSEIAVVGMSGRFPMAEDLEVFWQNLKEGKNCISEVPESRWSWKAIYGDPQTEVNKTNIKWGGFIDGIDEFDALFFGISPKEAIFMDPQQRLLMTYAWKAIEDAGYSAQSLSGSHTAIYVGTAASGYAGLIAQANMAIEGYSATGIVSSVGPNRMSYLLDIHGPSEPIETACSSSLVAIHRAVISIEAGQCDNAIVGGISTIVSPEGHIGFSKAGMLSEDGQCKTFSSKADGYVRGEGVGMLFLKSLSRAEQDGDHIYGVIKGSAENHGGRAASLTAPNPKAQADLLETAYTKAGMDIRTISYIEAHGTGTELGDPIEINGLKSAFKNRYEASGSEQIESIHCGLGSVKTNIGHLELAAGIAGVIKVLLQFKHRTLVKSLHFDAPNPLINLDNSPFYIVDSTREWPRLSDDSGLEIPRRAGVSSFGFGGVNAHVVIEEYQPSIAASQGDLDVINKPVALILSAKNEERLHEQAVNLLARLENPECANYKLSDVAYTLQVGRDAMLQRLAFEASSIEDVKHKLHDLIEQSSETAGIYYSKVKSSKALSKAFGKESEREVNILEWSRTGQLDRLMALWSQGQEVNWNMLYGQVKPKRLSLPSYPFAKQKCWVTKADPVMAPIADNSTLPVAATKNQHFWDVVKSGDTTSFAALIDASTSDYATRSHSLSELLDKLDKYSSSLETRPANNDWLYNTEWQKHGALASEKNSALVSGQEMQGRWLILSDGSILSGNLVRAINAAGGEVIVVEMTDSDFKSDEPLAAVRTRIETAVNRSTNIRGMINLWGLTTRESGSLPSRGLESSLYALQSVVKIFKDQPISCWILTSQSASTTMEDSIQNPEHSMIKGLGRIFSLEHSDYWGGLIDLPKDLSDRTGDNIVSIINEPNEDAFALRSDGVYIERLKRFQSEIKDPASWNTSGSVLITGGLGGIGFTLAQSLVKQGVKQLFLTDISDTASEAQAIKIREMESNGCRVDIISADVTNEHSMSDLLAKIKQVGIPLTTVFHAAGVSDFTQFKDCKQNNLARVLHAKVEGAKVLAHVLKDERLENLVFFSSIMGVLAAHGEAAYASSNKFLDSFSHSLRAAGVPATSLAWGPWAEIGMAKEHILSFEAIGLKGIKTEDATEILFHALQQDRSHLIIADIDWNVYHPYFNLSRCQLFSDIESDLTPVTNLPSQINYHDFMHLGKAERDTKILDYMTGILSKALLIEPALIKPESDIFSDFGVDSIMAMAILKSFKDDLKIFLYPRELIERSKLNRLASYISDEFEKQHALTTNSDGASKPDDLIADDLNTEGTKAKLLASFENTATAESKQTLVKGNTHGSDEKLSSAVFILSSPRAGSTLLRSMLAGHPQLFSPPELHLLNFENMQQRNDQLDDSYMGEGLQRAFMELHQQNADESVLHINQLVADGKAIKDVYSELQSALGSQMLVDKSPGYAMSIDALNRAEALFDKPKYIHLVRHPYAVIESFTRLRMEKLLWLENENSHEFAEGLWYQANYNINQFFSTAVSSDRALQVRYEDLVAEPEITAKRICAFLELDYSPEFLSPYAEGRMTDGIHPLSQSIGDPNFHNHEDIDKSLGQAWKTISLPNSLNDKTSQLAKQYSYELPAESNVKPQIVDYSIRRASTLNASGCELAISEWGDPRDPPILCIHGFLEQGPIWEDVALGLAAYGYRVIAPDLRGHGLSSHTKDSQYAGLVDFIADLEVVITKFVKEPVVLVGHSIGAILSAMYASSRPENVKSLIMVEAIVPGEKRVEDIVSNLRDNLTSKGKTKTLQHKILKNHDVAAEHMTLTVPGLTPEMAIMLAARVTLEVEGGYKWTWDPRLRNRVAFHNGWIDRTAYLDILASLTLPIMIINGFESEHRQKEDQLAISHSLPNAQCVDLYGGHHVHIDSPDASADHIHQFCTEINPAPTLLQAKFI